MRITAALLVVFAATLRFNGFLAGVPILLVAAGPNFWATRMRVMVTATLAAMALLALALHNHCWNSPLPLTTQPLLGLPSPSHNITTGARPPPLSQ